AVIACAWKASPQKLCVRHSEFPAGGTPSTSRGFSGARLRGRAKDRGIFCCESHQFHRLAEACTCRLPKTTSPQLRARFAKASIQARRTFGTTHVFCAHRLTKCSRPPQLPIRVRRRHSHLY